MSDEAPCRERQKINASWLEKELREAGVPFFVKAETLRQLGLNPDEFLLKQHDCAPAWALDRTKHQDIIERVKQHEQV